MLVFFYDKTFAGLLCAVFDAYTAKSFPDLLLGHGEVAPLTATARHEVEVDQQKARRVWQALQKKLARRTFSDLQYAALADDAKSATLIFNYIRKIFDSQDVRRFESDLTDPDVLAVFDLSRKVGREKHQLMGFARFQKTAQGVYFAAIEPRYDILPLLVEHFHSRFGEEQWILYDVRRRYGIYHDGSALLEMQMNPDLLQQGSLPQDLLDKDEKTFQALWQSYFSAAAIAARTNPELQARCMPRRFWKYLPEKKPL